MTRLHLLAGLAISGCLAACATSPTGRTQFMVFSEQTAIAASKQAYTEMLTPLVRENKINTDARLNARAGRIVDRLVAQAVAMRPETGNWSWDLKIIDDPKTVNAWAMAGGKMALYTGLITVIAPTDDELAQVLAHEISHALARHSVEKMSVATAASIGVQTVGVATGYSPVAMQGGALIAALAVSLPNSRAMEYEADRIGIELAARAGFNPAAAVTLWDKMSQAGGRAPPEFLGTHPNPEARKAALEALVTALTPLYEQAR